ncbi:MAG TPA: hypothetical protein DEB40_02775 [Elusimicrobia bacterium]|nr:hypothetical protein [Elusimicrobiota bacterium]HBT60654.1 hypothetical protein [Elusimicrobiota bacterium]
MVRKIVSVALCVSLIGLCAGLEPWQAAAAQIAQVRVHAGAAKVGAVAIVPPGVPLRRMGGAARILSGPQKGLLPAINRPEISDHPGFAAARDAGVSRPAASVAAFAAPGLGVGKGDIPRLAVAAGQEMPGRRSAEPADPAQQDRTPFAKTMERLQAPSLIAPLAKGGAEAIQGAAGQDFSRRVGESLEPAGAVAADGTPVFERSSLASSRASSPQAFFPPGVAGGVKAQAGKQAKSPVFPVAIAAGATALWGGAKVLLGGFASQTAVPSLVHAVLQAAAGGAAMTAMAVGSVFAALAVFEMGAYAYGMWRGRSVTDTDFWNYVRDLVMNEGFDAGKAELLRIHRPAKKSLRPEFGFVAGGAIYLRPELAATPWLFRVVLSHELEHLRARDARAPPAGRAQGLGRRMAQEFMARAAELKSAGTVRQAKIPVLERILRLAGISLALARPYDVLVVNADSAELKNPGVYQALSNDKARVEVVDSSDPRQVLDDSRNLRRFEVVVLGKSFEIVPEEKSTEAEQLEQALRQLDSLFVLATRRMAQRGAFLEGSDNAQRYENLVAMAQRIDQRGAKAQIRFEKLVREFWQDITGARLKGMKFSGVAESLYKAMANKGVAFLPFSLDDDSLLVWERFLRFWEAPDGGQFRMLRVDLENGGHILVLRKVEARVGLWLRSLKGFIAVSVPQADKDEESREAARTALAAAGFSDQLEKFDELGVEIQQVLGADVGSQEIYVTVPRRNAGAMRRFISGLAMNVESSQTNFEPQLFEAADLHQVRPVWRMGITGVGGTMIVLDTSADNTHDDFSGRAEVVDAVNEGPEDRMGHGTHVLGALISNNPIFTGMVKAGRAIMYKVFSSLTPGAADGTIKGSAAAGMQKGGDGFNLSFGSKGSSGDDLAMFFSELTHHKNANGEYVFVAASGGNSGPFDRTMSQPAVGDDVVAVAAAGTGNAPSGITWPTRWNDGVLEIVFFSGAGPDLDRRYSVERVRIKPDVTGKGGDVTTAEGSANVYPFGVYSAKSKDMPKSPSDLPDGKHMGMSGTSMAAPIVAGILLLIKLAIRLMGAETPYVKEHLPLVLKAVVMRTADDMRLPVWFQGAGLANAWAAVKLVAELVGYVISDRASNLVRRWFGRIAPASDDPNAWDWVARYEAVMDLEDRVYKAAEVVKNEAQARFETDPDGEEEAPTEERQAADETVRADMQAQFNAARDQALPDLLKALQDPVWLVRRQAALVLRNLKAPDSAMPLAEAALKDSDGRVRQMAFLALAENPSHAVDALLQKASADAQWDVALYSAYALARHGDRSGVGRILSELSHKDKWVRFTATWLLGQLGDKATQIEAEALSYLVKNLQERGNIRHLAAAALFNFVGVNPGAISGDVIQDLLEASGPQNLALTRTVAKIFPSALSHKDILAQVRSEPLKSVVTDFVLRNRAAVSMPGALGDLVSLLARTINVPLDLPTPFLDPAGAGIAGVDPVLGPLDVIVTLPRGRELSAYRDFHGDAAAALSEAGLRAETISKHGAELKAAMPASRSLWLSVPSHKFFALSLELKNQGYGVRLSLPQYALSRRSGDASWEGLTLDLSGDYPEIPPQADISLVRVTADHAASEARVMAVLEAISARVNDPLKKPAVIAVSLGSQGEPHSPLSRLINRLILRDIGVILPAGNEGPGEDSVSALAKGGLAVVVAAAGRTSGLEAYSGRGSDSDPVVSWTDLVDDFGAALPLLSDAAAAAARAILGEDGVEKDGAAGQAPYVEIGTGPAAERTARNISALARRMAEALAAKNSVLPSGYFFYLVDLVKSTLSSLPGARAAQAGAGVFDHPDRARELLETRLLDAGVIAREAPALRGAAQTRYLRSLPPETMGEAAQKAVFSAAEAVGTPIVARPEVIAAAAELTRRVVGASSVRANAVSGDGVERVRELRAVLGAGVSPAAGSMQPFAFRKTSGEVSRARAAGLEGFLYSKLEIQGEGDNGLDMSQIEDYFNYLDSLLSGFDWTKPLRRDIESIRRSRARPAQKSRRLDKRLIAAVKEYQTELRAADASNWFRVAGIHAIDVPASMTKGFLDSLGEREILRIRKATRADTFLLRLGREPGYEEGLKDFVRRVHAMGLRVGVEWMGRGRDKIAPKASELGVDFVRQSAVYTINGQGRAEDGSWLQESLVSGDPGRIREALKDCAYRSWQHGGASAVQSLALVGWDAARKYGRFFKAAALLTLLLRPGIVAAGQDMNPDIPAPELREFMDILSLKSFEYRDLFSRGTMEVLDASPGSPVVAYSVSAGSAASRKTLLAAANFATGRAGALFRFKAALAAVGAFVPQVDKTYLLRDFVNKDVNGRPVTYARSGKELVEKGLYVELDAGGVHLFEVVESPIQPGKEV